MRFTPSLRRRAGGVALLAALAAPAITSAQTSVYQLRLGLIRAWQRGVIVLSSSAEQVLGGR